MNGFFIYVLKITKNGEVKYYVGKTSKLAKRMKNHFNGNNESAKKIIDFGYTVKEVECIFRFIDSEELTDSYTSLIESQVAKDMILKYGYDNVRGGCYLNSWDDNNVNLLPTIDINKIMLNDEEIKNRINKVFSMNLNGRVNITMFN